MRKRASAAICLLMVACSGETEHAPSPKPIITVENAAPPYAGVRIDLGAVERSGKLIEVAGEAIKSFGADLIAGRSPVKEPVMGYNFTVIGPVSDDAAVGGKILHLSYRDNELRQMVHMGADTETILGAAVEVGSWTPANDYVVNDYCDARKESGFCKRLEN